MSALLNARTLAFQALEQAATNRGITDCLRWSNRRIVLGSGTMQGPYTTERHRWVEGILNCQAPNIAIMKGAQLGLSVAAMNFGLYNLIHRKRNTAYILPTLGDARDFSASRFDPLVRDSPYLASVFTNVDRVDLKQCGSANLYVRGAKSDSGLKSFPADLMILDEIAEYSERAVQLALERLSGSLDPKVFALSTPTVPGDRIDELYQNGTQEHFFFPCPSCSRKIELTIDNLVVCGQAINDPDVERSHIKCAECDAELRHEAKAEFLADAEWIAGNADANKDFRSFYINQLYAATVTPAALARQVIRARSSEAAAQELANSKLGQTFIGQGAKLHEKQIRDCFQGHSIFPFQPPTGPRRLITLGADQGKVGYIVVNEWQLEGNPGFDINGVAVPKVIYIGKFTDDWSDLDSLMRQYQVLAAVIDADPEISEARRFARRFPGYVWLCRYRGGVSGKEMAETERDTGAPMIHVDRTCWMDLVQKRFINKTIQLPMDTPGYFISHCEAPIKRYKKDGDGNDIAHFVNTSADHSYHALTYAEIALPYAASLMSGGKSIKSFL